MKLLSRDFTLAERLLIIGLALVLVALAYYQFIDKPVRRDLAAAQAEKENLELELTVAQAKVATLTKMQDEIDAIMADGSINPMPSYNNMKAELELLNVLLASTNDYAVSFNSLTRDGDQIRRNFSLRFTVSNYQTMEWILRKLSESEYRCLVGDVQCNVNYVLRNNSANSGTSGSANSSTNNSADNSNKTGSARVETSYTVYATATFYETMVGGVADAGLPESGKAAS